MRQDLREIRESSLDELIKLLEKARSDLYDMRVSAKIGQMEKTADIKKSKKHLARILTEINARKKIELAEAKV